MLVTVFLNKLSVVASCIVSYRDIPLRCTSEPNYHWLNLSRVSSPERCVCNPCNFDKVLIFRFSNLIIACSECMKIAIKKENFSFFTIQHSTFLWLRDVFKSFGIMVFVEMGHGHHKTSQGTDCLYFEWI